MTAYEGWHFLPGARKAHYFRDARALCGRWGYFGHDFEPDTAIASPDDCLACLRVLDRERVSV